MDVRILDVRGRQVARDAVRGSGVFRWSGLDDRGAPAAAGVYYARFAGDGASVTRKIVLAR